MNPPTPNPQPPTADLARQPAATSVIFLRVPRQQKLALAWLAMKRKREGRKLDSMNAIAADAIDKALAKAAFDGELDNLPASYDHRGGDDAASENQPQTETPTP